MGSSFGQVVPVIGTLIGFIGEPSRSGGGNPFIVSKQANANNAANINFGDVVMLLADQTGGTYQQLADWLTLPAGGFKFTATVVASSTTMTPTSLAGLAVGQWVWAPKGTLLPGTKITAIGSSTVTLSQAAEESATYTDFYAAALGGIAVREVKTQLGYPYTPGVQTVGYYQAGQYVGCMTEGAITVKCTVGTPQTGLPVYIRVALNSGVPAGLLGDLEAAPDNLNTVMFSAGGTATPDAEWKTGTQDTNGVTELTILRRIAA